MVRKTREELRAEINKIQDFEKKRIERKQLEQKLAKAKFQSSRFGRVTKSAGVFFNKVSNTTSNVAKNIKDSRQPIRKQTIRRQPVKRQTVLRQPIKKKKTFNEFANLVP